MYRSHSLYFLAQLSGTDLFDIYSTSRASAADGLGVATALLNVNVTGEQARYPYVSDRRGVRRGSLGCSRHRDLGSGRR